MTPSVQHIDWSSILKRRRRSNVPAVEHVEFAHVSVDITVGGADGVGGYVVAAGRTLGHGALFRNTIRYGDLENVTSASISSQPIKKQSHWLSYRYISVTISSSLFITTTNCSVNEVDKAKKVTKRWLNWAKKNKKEKKRLQPTSKASDCSCYSYRLSIFTERISSIKYKQTSQHLTQS